MDGQCSNLRKYTVFPYEKLTPLVSLLSVMAVPRKGHNSSLRIKYGMDRVQNGEVRNDWLVHSGCRIVTSERTEAQERTKRTALGYGESTQIIMSIIHCIMCH